jgi:hypothetical protein
MSKGNLEKEDEERRRKRLMIAKARGTIVSLRAYRTLRKAFGKKPKTCAKQVDAFSRGHST